LQKDGTWQNNKGETAKNRKAVLGNYQSDEGTAVEEASREAFIQAAKDAYMATDAYSDLCN